MSRHSAPSQGGLLTALGAHLELLGALLKKADACGDLVPQSSVASLFKNASAYVINDPSAKKLARQAGKETAGGPDKARQAPCPGAPPAGAPAAPSPCSDSEFLEAAISGGGEAMLSVLGRRADPNKVFKNFRVGRRAFVEGTALGIAAQRGELEAVSALLRHGARPDATYSVTVGAAKTTESFPVGFSVVRDQNIELLEMLLGARADLRTMTSSLDATMLWEAAYFGKETMAHYLLDNGVDIDAAATSQDNRAWRFTALHAASYKGELAVVNLLLQRRAFVDGRNVDGRTPLADAIIKGHGDIVRMLIAARAELFDVSLPQATRSTMHSMQRKGSRKFGITFMAPMWNAEDASDPQTPIQLLFNEANDHTIAEAAKGLQLAPREIDTRTFIRFLSALGNAPIEIMKAVSQPQELWYWNSKNERAHVQTAMMKPHATFIVGYGPHGRKLKEMFDKKERVAKEVQAFIEDIAPESRGSKAYSGSRRVRGRLMMCDVPRIFFNPEVLLAMARCPIPEFFEMQSVQAIVNVHWRECVGTANFQIVFQVLYCTVSMCLNLLLLEFAAWDFALMVATWVCLGFWLVEVTLEICELIGFYYARLTTVYFTRSNAIDWARLCMSGVMLIVAVVQKADAKQYVWFNVCFGIMMLVRWMRMLYSFVGVKFFGIYLLPITECLSHVVPFCSVLFPFVGGAFNMYYSFNLQGPLDSLVIILRLILNGDQNLLELEGAQYDDTGNLVTNAENRREYYFIVRAFMVVCSMVMGTAMMNIFIAVLSEQYSEAFRVRYGRFFRSRAELAVREHITWRGVRRAVDLLRMPSGHAQAALEDEGDYGGNYIWYFQREEEPLEEALAERLEKHKDAIISEVQKCHSVLTDEVRRAPSTHGTSAV